LQELENQIDELRNKLKEAETQAVKVKSVCTAQLQSVKKWKNSQGQKLPVCLLSMHKLNSERLKQVFTPRRAEYNLRNLMVNPLCPNHTPTI